MQFMKTVIFRVEGKVQGVWFRQSTKQFADRLGVVGYAKNMSDGSVEVVAQGNETEIAELGAFISQGPPLAEVSRIVSSMTDAEPMFGFKTF